MSGRPHAVSVGPWTAEPVPGTFNGVDGFGVGLTYDGRHVAVLSPADLQALRLCTSGITASIRSWQGEAAEDAALRETPR